MAKFQTIFTLYTFQAFVVKNVPRLSTVPRIFQSFGLSTFSSFIDIAGWVLSHTSCYFFECFQSIIYSTLSSILKTLSAIWLLRLCVVSFTISACFWDCPKLWILHKPRLLTLDGLQVRCLCTKFYVVFLCKNIHCSFVQVSVEFQYFIQ